MRIVNAGCFPVYEAVVDEWSNKSIKLERLNMSFSDTCCYGALSRHNMRVVYSLTGFKSGKTLSADFLELPIQNKGSTQGSNRGGSSRSTVLTRGISGALKGIKIEDTQVQLIEQELDCGSQYLLEKLIGLGKTDDHLFYKIKTLRKDHTQGLINLRKDIANKIAEKDEYFQEIKTLDIAADKRISEMDADDPDSVYGKSAEGLGIEGDVGEKPSV